MMVEGGNFVNLGSRNDSQICEMLHFRDTMCEVWLFVPSLFSSVIGSESPKLF